MNVIKLMLKNGLSTVTGFLGGWKGWLAMFALGACLATYSTWRVMSWREAAKEVKTITRTVTQIKHQDRITERVVTKYVKVREQLAEDTRNRINEVETHVTPEADSHCVVPVGFVRVHVGATHGPVPDASAGADDAPSGVALSDVAKIDVENAGIYDAIANQLTALQSWVKEQRALSEKHQ